MNRIQTHANTGLANVLLRGYSQMNSLRLAQALSNKDAGSLNGVQQNAFSGNLSATDTEFLKDYQREMRELKEIADKAIAGGEKSRLTASAEDPDVAQVSGKLEASADQYKLTVEQLALGQVNRSVDLESRSPMPVMSGVLRLETGQGKFEFYMSAAGARDNRGMLDNFAAKINAQQTGVAASVEEKDGKARLRLEGASGAGNTFSVSGSLAERLGLEQTVQTGQDAIYTVEKNGGKAQTFSSGSNTITVDGRLTASLKGTGSTVIRTGGSVASGLADTVSQLVDKFNETLRFLNRNSDRGIGVLNQIRRMITPPTSEKSMELAGITIRGDGSLIFDRTVFLSKAEQAPSLVEGIIENFANGIRTDAQMGMQERSGGLIDAQQYLQGQADSQKSLLNFMGQYNRSGVYNMMNYYAVGVLMNLNI